MWGKMCGAPWRSLCASSSRCALLLRTNFTLDWRCTLWNLLTSADTPPTKNMFWNSFVNTIQMPWLPLIPLHGISWNNSGPWLCLPWMIWCGIAILYLDLNQDSLPTCCVPTCFPLNARSLPLLHGLPILSRTISMPSCQGSRLGIRPAQVLFMIFSTVCGFRTVITSLIQSTRPSKSQKSLTKKGERLHQ